MTPEEQVQEAKNTPIVGSNISPWGAIDDLDAAIRYYEGARQRFNWSPRFVQDSDAQLVLWLQELKRLRGIETGK